MGLKKTLGALLGAVALTVSLVACGGGGNVSELLPQDDGLEAARADAVGSWEMTSARSGDQTVTEEDYETMTEYGMHVTLDLDEDGNLLLDMFGEQLTGTWELKDESTLTLTIEGDSVDAPFTGEELVIDLDEQSMTFGKVSDTPTMDRDPSENGGGVTGDSDDKDDADDADLDDDWLERFTEDSIESNDLYVNSYVTQTSTMDITIADDETARIVLLGLGEDYEDTGYVFEIENRTDVDLYVQNVYTDLDGVDVWDDATIMRVVPAGETCKAFFWFDADAGLSVDESSSLDAAIGLYDINQDEYGVYWVEL